MIEASTEEVSAAEAAAEGDSAEIEDSEAETEMVDLAEIESSDGIEVSAGIETGERIVLEFQVFTLNSV